jgi:hypothetical protein
MNMVRMGQSQNQNLEDSGNLKDASLILEAIDREIAFYRRRAGQVFSIGLFVEGLILVGREKIVVLATWPWIQPLVYGIFFIAVAAIGIALGSEYLERIHILKDKRTELLAKVGYQNIYPVTGGLHLSEIQVLYVVLIFLSSSGLILVWLNALKGKDDLDWVFWFLFWLFIIVGACGICYAGYKVVRWLIEVIVSNTYKASDCQGQK